MFISNNAIQLPLQITHFLTIKPTSFPEHFVQKFPRKTLLPSSFCFSMLMRAMWSCSALHLERSRIPDIIQPDLILSTSVAKSLRYPELQLVLAGHDCHVEKQALGT